MEGRAGFGTKALRVLDKLFNTKLHLHCAAGAPAVAAPCISGMQVGICMYTDVSCLPWDSEL